MLGVKLGGVNTEQGNPQCQLHRLITDCCVTEEMNRVMRVGVKGSFREGVKDILFEEFR